MKYNLTDYDKQILIGRYQLIKEFEAIANDFNQKHHNGAKYTFFSGKAAAYKEAAEQIKWIYKLVFGLEILDLPITQDMEAEAKEVQS